MLKTKRYLLPAKCYFLAAIFLLLLATCYLLFANRAPRPLPLTRAAASSNFLYAAESKDLKIFLGANKTNLPTVKLQTSDTNLVSFTLTNTDQNLKKPKKQGNKLIFSEVRNSTDLTYETLPNGIKEELIIKSPQPGNSFTFDMEIFGVNPKAIFSDIYGSIFYDNNGKYLFHFAKPFAIDSAGNRTDAVLLQLQKDKKDHTFKAVLTVNQAWLESPERVYPIIVDPTVVHDTTAEFATGQLNRVTDTGTGSGFATGGTVTSSGGYTIHTFTSGGTFTVNGSGNVEVLVVGGGGGGSKGQSGVTYGGAGGGGGVQYNSSYAVTAQAYTVTVGDGGSAATGGSQNGGNGNSSTFDTITAGGGVGGGYNGDGGASGTPQSLAGVNRSGITGGAGGGSGGAGVTTTGGAGTASAISGSSVNYGGGGGGSNDSVSGTGTDGGGNGGALNTAPTSGTANRGGGGGSTRQENPNNAGAGGSGIVIIRYPSNLAPSLTTYYQELSTDINTIGLYHFGNGACATDSSGNAYTLTANGGMTCTTDGMFGYKASGFATTPVSYSHTTILDRALTSGTIETWINPANLSAVQTILYADSTSDTLLTLGTSGQINFSTSASTNLATANNVIVINTWTHVAATWTTAGHKIFINGVETASDTNTTTHTSQDYTTYIGVGSGGNTLPFSGSLDEVSISNIARTQEEIKLDASRRPYSVYTSDVIDLTTVTSWTSLSWSELGVATGDGETLSSSTSLVAQWNFNETSGTTADNAETTTDRDFTLNNFASTASQDQAASTGWTAANKRWGAGGIMLSSVATADTLSITNPGGNGLDPNSSDLSIEMWVKTNDVTAELLSNNSANGVACTSNGYYLGIDASGYPVFYLDTNGATAGCDAQISAPTTKINDGNWHLLTVSVTRGTSAVMYLDGINIGSDTSVTSYSSITVAGNVLVGSTNNFDGIIDSTRVYSRALGQNEILSNYQAGNVELQTRVGASTDANDGTWEAWKPTTGETVIDNMDNPLDWATPSASIYTGALIATSSATLPLAEGTKSLKLQTGQITSLTNTVGLWHLDETGGTGAYIKDSTANANHATPTGTSVVNGFTGKARSFNGTSDVITRASVTTYNTSRTVEFWFNPTTTGGQRGIISVGSVWNDTTPMWLIVQTSGNLLSVYHGANYRNGTTVLAANQWYYGAYTFNSSNNAAALYLNGNLEYSGTVADYNGSNTNLYIGAGYNAYFSGKLDEIRISNTARTHEEIAEAYRAGRDHYLNKTISSTDLSAKTSLPFYVASDRQGTFLNAAIGESTFANYQTDANTVGLWHLDEQSGSGAYFKDSSGLGNHGTPTGTTFVQGKIGKARDLNGSSDHIDLSNAITFTGDGTIELWVYIHTKQSALFTGNNLTEGYWGYFSGGNFYINWGNNFQTFTDVFSTNTWTHIAMIRSGTNYLLYKNGILQQTVAGAANTGTLRCVGVLYCDGGYGYFDGVMDEIRISNTARTADQIRQAYEVGARTHNITIDFKAALNSGNLITGTSDLGFTIDATAYGASAMGSNLYLGDKIIVKENYDGTEYIAQGTVNSLNTSTGAVTVTVWDSGSTVPSGGFTVNATIFKWQREYFDLRGNLSTQRDAITNLTIRETDGSQGATVWLDDFRSSGGYLTTPGGSTITSSTGNRYFQYRIIPTSFDPTMASSVTSVTLDYVSNSAPATPSLDLPTDTATNQSLLPIIKTTTTDADSDYLRYKIHLCTDSGMTANCQTFDQTASQTGWSGQNTQTNTAYTSGTQGVYTLQTVLSASTVYYWKSYAIDPGGSNGWSSTQTTPYSFTTTTAPSAPTTPYAEGLTNPSGILDTTPEFSAIHNDANGDSANYYEIEVNTASDFSGTVMWDSGQQSMAATANAARSPDVSYAGTALTLNGSTYYWRIRFWDTNGAVGAWSATQNFTMNSAPATPSLDLPANGASNIDLYAVLKTTTTDADSDYLRYKIHLCTDSGMTANCQTFDQTASQTGWSGQNTQTNTAYTSGTQGVYTLQTVLSASTVYYWKSYAIDPGGSNGWSSTQTTAYSFTTQAAPTTPSVCVIEESSFDTLLTVKWTDNSTNENGYRIDRSADGAAFSTLDGNLSANTISYNDTAVSQSHTYQYRIAAFFTAGPTYSAWCTTPTLSLQSASFQMQGIQFQGVKIN